MKPVHKFVIIIWCLLMRVQRMTATTCLKTFSGDIALSSILDGYPADNCVDGDIDTMCQTKDEDNPYFMIEYEVPTKITEVIVIAPKDCCWDRVKELVVIVSDTKPTKGQLALSYGTQLGSTFYGPATSQQAITFSSLGLSGKYVIVQQHYKGVMNLAEIEVNTGNFCKKNETDTVLCEKHVAMSSTLTNYPAEQCVDRNDDTFCHTEDEENPYFVIEYNHEIKVYDVNVITRKNCCWNRVKDVAVFVTNTKPTKGHLALGSQLGTKFEGPATEGAQVINFKSETGLTGKYVIVQQQYKGVMNLAEVLVNKRPRVSATLSSMWKSWCPYARGHPAEDCLDGDIDTMCHTKYEENPYFMIEYDSPIKINEVRVIARKGVCCWDRVKELVVIVTDTKPTKGQSALALGTQLGSTFKGPAKRQQVITFTAAHGVMGKYVIVQQLYTGAMNLAEVEVNPGPPQCKFCEKYVAMSSQLMGYPAEKCVDRNDNTFCRTADEENPYFVIEYNEEIKIYDIKVTARKNWSRVKDIVVIVTNTRPTKGQLALDSGSQLGKIFEGPATKGVQVMTFKSANEVTGKYVVVQQKSKGVMNLAEVQVNRDHNMKSYFQKLKNVYRNCIEHPDCKGCAPIINQHLPKLIQKNIIKEGEIGVNNGSISVNFHLGSKDENYIMQQSTTLNLRTVGDIKTIKTVNEMVTINGTCSGYVGGKRWYGHMHRRPTGLYAGPGDLVTITFPEALVGKIYIDIGHYQFKLSFPVETSTVKIGSPYGGLIIIWMKGKDAYPEEFTFSVTNAIKAPCFIYGKTTNKQWEEMRHYSPKWSVLRVLGQVEIFVQTLKIKDITDMNTTMARIKDTMDLLEESVGLPAGSKPGAEILILDPGLTHPLGFHVGGGTCWAGVNVCGDSLYTEDKVNTDTSYDDFFKQDGTNHLILHEFGHGYCLGDFPDMGNQWTAETVSSYIRYTKGRFEKHYDVVHSGMVKKDLDFWLLERMVGFSLYSGGEPCGEVNFNSKQFNTNDYERCWKWLNWFPQKAHGWKIWKDVNTLDAKSTKHYSTQTDRMVDLYCQATKHNMLPMFNFYNIQPSDESITNSCKKLPESKPITKWINVAKCVRQSITDGDKDIRECGKMPGFPEHKGLCVISGVCNMDETNNGETTTLNKKFDLYGSTGKRLAFADKNFPNTSTSVKKETCFKRAADFFQGCKNNYEHSITATFYGKEQGKELSYNESSYTFPTTGPFMSSKNKHYPEENCMDGRKDTFCHTENEENPFFLIGYAEPIEVTDVKVTVRKNCCWERAKQMVVIVTNTAPTRGQLASGLQLGGTFIGPATHSAQVITFKSKTGITGKYVIVQQRYKGVMNLAEVQVNNGTGSFATARSSSTYDNNLEKYGPLQSIDGASFFHSKQENYPWLELKLWEPIKVSDVTIINRKDCCGERLKDAVIRTGMDKVPDGTKNQLLTTNEVCGTYAGPAATGETVRIFCAQPIKAEYITIQLNNNNGILQVKEVGINRKCKFSFVTACPYFTEICEKNLCSSTEGCPLAKNTLLAFLPELKMEFKITFEFRAMAWKSGWNPCFAIGDNGRLGYYCDITTKTYTLNTWHSMEFSQTLKNGKYMFRVVVDGEDSFAPVENTNPRTFSNVKVYAADNWYNPLEGSIRNLLVNKGCGAV